MTLSIVHLKSILQIYLLQLFYKNFLDMNLKLTLYGILLLFVLQCKGPESKSQIQIVDKSTGFRMNLPKGFQQLTEAETDKMLTLGKKQVDALHNSDIDISDKDPIIFKKDNNNYFMIHVKEYDPSIDGDYNEAVRNTKNEL